MTGSEMAQRLPEALSGHDTHSVAAGSLAEDARRHLFESCMGRLASCIAAAMRSRSSDDAALGDHVRDLAARADDHALVKVVGAPDVVGALRAGRRREALLLVDSGLTAERARREATPYPGMPPAASLMAERVPRFGQGGRWSVLGDYWLDDDGQVWTAPTVAGRIVIDYASPSARAARVHGSSEAPTQWPEIAPSDAELFIDSLSVGYSFLDRVWPDAGHMVQTATTVVIPRVDPVLPGFGSFTTSDHLGRTLLSNGWDGDLTPLFLAETMLHESVHSLVFLLEEAQAWFNDAAAVAAAKAESPWTGDVIIARNYVHACFVWFAVWSFFRRAVESGSQSGLLVRRLEQAAGGFTSGTLISRQRASDWRLADHVADLVSEVQGIVRRLS